MLDEVIIPEQITVHLGTPDSNAPNVTLPFPDYIKNVASSEIFPTWPENALRANIYAIVTFALNRIFTEWYRSRGYDFDITSSTQFDQAFVNGREIFENISQLTDELFNDYIRRQGSVEPLFASFCNGTTVTCSGLSQWGTVGLAEENFLPYEILTYYYGDNIDLVFNAPTAPGIPSWPDIVLSEGMTGNEIRTLQVELNRIGRNYPAIPKIPEETGIFDAATTDAVRVFQQVFGLPVTGTVDKTTWYKIAYIFTSVKRLAELNSEGLTVDEAALAFSRDLRAGAEGSAVRNAQYFLAVVGAYYASVPRIEITGVYDEQTEAAVRAFQETFGLPQTGIIDRRTWNDLYRAYLGIAESLPPESTEVAIFPGGTLREGAQNDSVRILQEYLTFLHFNGMPEIPEVSNTGYFGPVTKSAVQTFQRLWGLPVNGQVSAITWDSIASAYSNARYGTDKRPYQYPGYVIA